MDRTRTMTLRDALDVVERMRPQDRECLDAVMPGVSDEQFAVNRWQTEGPAWTLLNRTGNPVAIGGLSFSSAWSAVFWFVATPEIAAGDWVCALRKLDHVISATQKPGNAVFKHRVEAYTLATWEESVRLAKSRFVLEGVKRGAGSTGQDILMWSVAKQK